MTFVDTTDDDKRSLIGREHGATRLFLLRGCDQRGTFAGLHTHGGDEAIRVISGRVLFTIGSEHRVCGPGTLVFVPPHVEHGFVALDNSVVEIYGELEMGEFVTVLTQEGARRTVEIFVASYPWTRCPPAGVSHTTKEEMQALFETTRLLLYGEEHAGAGGAVADDLM